MYRRRRKRYKGEKEREKMYRRKRCKGEIERKDVEEKERAQEGKRERGKKM